MDLGNEDDNADPFEDLRVDLPKIGPDQHMEFESHIDQGISNWLVGRFGRTVRVTIAEMTRTCFALVSSHWNICIISYLIYIVVLWVSRKDYYLCVLFVSFFSYFGFFFAWKVRRRQSLREMITILKSIPNICSFMVFVISSVLVVSGIARIMNLLPTSTPFLALHGIWDFFSFFIPCLCFDDPQMPWFQSVELGLKVTFLPGVPLSLLEFLILYYTLQLFSPVTIGITYFVASCIRVNLFLSLVGTRSAQ